MASPQRIRPPSSDGFNKLKERFDHLQKSPSRPTFVLPSRSSDAQEMPNMELVLSDDDEVSLLSGGSILQGHPVPIQVVPSNAPVNQNHTTNDASSLLSKPRTFVKTNVQWCHSEGCPCCRPGRPGPRFLPAPKIAPKDIQRLPRHWWLQENVDEGWLDTMFGTLVRLFGLQGVTEACGANNYLPSDPQLQKYLEPKHCGGNLCHTAETKEDMDEEIPFDVMRARERFVVHEVMR